VKNWDLSIGPKRPISPTEILRRIRCRNPDAARGPRLPTRRSILLGKKLKGSTRERRRGLILSKNEKNASSLRVSLKGKKEVIEGGGTESRGV